MPNLPARRQAHEKLKRKMLRIDDIVRLRTLTANLMDAEGGTQVSLLSLRAEYLILNIHCALYIYGVVDINGAVHLHLSLTSRRACMMSVCMSYRISNRAFVSFLLLFFTISWTCRAYAHAAI